MSATLLFVFDVLYIGGIIVMFGLPMLAMSSMDKNTEGKCYDEGIDNAAPVPRIRPRTSITANEAKQHTVRANYLTRSLCSDGRRHGGGQQRGFVLLSRVLDADRCYSRLDHRVR